MKRYKPLFRENNITDFYEYEEVQRTIDELQLSYNIEEIIDRFNKTKIQKLDKSIWKILNNTDYDVNTEQDVKARLEQYERDLDNYDKVLKEFKQGLFYPSLIIHTEKDGYYLVAGNTRLMVSKVNNLIPTVKIISL